MPMGGGGRGEGGEKLIMHVQCDVIPVLHCDLISLDNNAVLQLGARSLAGLARGTREQKREQQPTNLCKHNVPTT